MTRQEKGVSEVVRKPVGCCEIKLPCPKCGKRIMDVKGHQCRGDFEIEIRCKNTRSCGYVWIKAQYIEKYLDKRER